MGTVASASLRPPAAVTAPAGGAEGAVAATARIPPTSHCLAGQKGATAPTTVAITTTSVCLHRDPNSGHQKLNQYELLREIGRGVHGKVRLARDTLTGQHYVSDQATADCVWKHCFVVVIVVVAAVVTGHKGY